MPDKDNLPAGGSGTEEVGITIMHALDRIISRNDGMGVDEEFKVEDEDDFPPVTASNLASKTIISFPQGDPENPYNWGTRKKLFVVVAVMGTVINSTLGSALPSGAIDYMAKYFNITNQEQLVLPISVFLLGYVVGPLLIGPLSETYGRKGVMLITFSLYTIFTLACAVAPTFASFLIFRLIAGVMASSPIAVVGGVYADIFDNPVTRGRAMALFMAATTFGPILGPIISGFISIVTWRWTFWVGFITAGVVWVPLLFLPETYGPILLKKRAMRMRKESGNVNIFAPIELEKKGWKQMMTITLTRPLRMIYSEAIVLFSCLYLTLAYAIFYLFFEAYPIIFQGIYGMSTGVSGLAFIPIGIGAFIACSIFLYYDYILERAKRNNAAWSRSEESRRLPLACIGGPLYLISLFWLGWSAKSSVHWIVPMLAGLPFGIGYLLIFMALLNYLTDAYEIFAASALAAASCCRSLGGALLPFATKPMYDKLGVNWGSSVLGFISLAMSIIPFAFIRYGDRIRANSKFCQFLLERKMSVAKAEEERAEHIENEKSQGAN
ncbi:MAG: hypothetical protein M1827_003352 [Pycnora praestabilis]|nr:MAG: hypothetical protein M1827_003352 [Pycnora praestabilis]